MPEYFNPKIKVAILLAPPTSMINVSCGLFEFMSKPYVMEFITYVGEKFMLLDWFPYNYYISKSFTYICSFFDGYLCKVALEFVEGQPIYDVDDMDRIEVQLSYMPTDSGAFSFKHYGQLMREKTHRFRRYDHGEEINMKKYNQTEPPDYQLSNIQFPMAIFSGKYDKLADPADVEWLVS